MNDDGEAGGFADLRAGISHLQYSFSVRCFNTETGNSIAGADYHRVRGVDHRYLLQILSPMLEITRQSASEPLLSSFSEVFP